MTTWMTTRSMDLASSKPLLRMSNAASKGFPAATWLNAFRIWENTFNKSAKGCVPFNAAVIRFVRVSARFPALFKLVASSFWAASTPFATSGIWAMFGLDGIEILGTAKKDVSLESV